MYTTCQKYIANILLVSYTLQYPPLALKCYSKTWLYTYVTCLDTCSLLKLKPTIKS